jgi:hypothetical protein
MPTKKKKTPSNASALAKPRATLPLMFTVPPGSEGLLTKAQIAGLLSIGESLLKKMIADGEYPEADIRLGRSNRKDP